MEQFVDYWRCTWINAILKMKDTKLAMILIAHKVLFIILHIIMYNLVDVMSIEAFNLLIKLTNFKRKKEATSHILLSV